MATKKDLEAASVTPKAKKPSTTAKQKSATSPEPSIQDSSLVTETLASQNQPDQQVDSAPKQPVKSFAIKATKKISETKKPRLGIKVATGAIHTVGKRKRSCCKLWAWENANPQQDSSFLVNGKHYADYFASSGDFVHHAVSPFVATHQDIKDYFVVCQVYGGGISAQSQAIRLALSKFLVQFEPNLKQALRTSGFLTRDSRIVESKKTGKRKARAKEQYSKR